MEEPRRAAARPHTGRRRNEAAREAVLTATMDLLRASGEELTVDRIARAAGVGKQTIYRWWPTKGAVVAEAMAESATAAVGLPDTGTLRGDLAAFFRASFAVLQDQGMVRLLGEVVTGAQREAAVADVLHEFTARRRAALGALLQRAAERGDLRAGADPAVLVDLGYGFLWYRLLVGHAPLDDAAADALADHLTAAATA
ncbi:TetR/AcrR family transcriptional regulator C-terminal ligand-binding domain-containing protein [Kitasatospora sp. NPDC059571]|uniref:TetR/AcrR family transcriptional regulator n=1 Tax=Kitasatospora sp. NPDC059571 TaxID=3346871 RepID=UPI0036C7EC01